MGNLKTWKGLSILAALALVLALGVLVLAPAMVATAATIQVTNNNDAGPGSLRQAIIDAAAGDEITFAATVTGTITLTSGQLFINKNLAITGPGADILTISGNNATRVLFSSSGANVIISGLTIADGVNYMEGGGIYNEGVVTLNNCTLRGNHAGTNGGAICSMGAVALNNCTVSSNTADYGGGIVSFEGGSVILNDCTVTGNTAAREGGGIYNDSVVALNKCTVSDNTAGSSGGIRNNYGRTLTLNNCTVSGNSADQDGGGILNWGTLTLNNCTVSGNTAAGTIGGGISSPDVANVKNSIIAGNNAPNGPDFCGILTSYGCNLVGNTSYCIVTGVETCSIYNKDPLLGPLQDNGGPTFTHALLEGSPAIDGVCTDCGCTTVDGVTVTTDQRGEPRPSDGDGDGTALCDMGAYELQPPPTPPIQPTPPGVPAMNQWGIAAMVIVFAGLLVWTVRRRLSAP
jgi:predicted outer membrane repeat protein